MSDGNIFVTGVRIGVCIVPKFFITVTGIPSNLEELLFGIFLLPVFVFL